MDARYKILFSGEFRSRVKKEEFVQVFSKYFGSSKEKAAALYGVDRKVTLKKNLSDVEVKRHMAAFEKMGMLVTSKLMMKPFVGPRIESESRTGHSGGDLRPWRFYLRVIGQVGKRWSGLIRTGKEER